MLFLSRLRLKKQQHQSRRQREYRQLVLQWVVTGLLVVSRRALQRSRVQQRSDQHLRLTSRRCSNCASELLLRQRQRQRQRQFQIVL